MEAPADKLLRLGVDADRAGDWSLVLAAAGIRHQLVQTPAGVELRVATADERPAMDALAAYDREQATDSGDDPAPPDWGTSYAGTALATALVCFHAVTGGRGGADAGGWFRAGSASAERILGGEPWRAVTALTLHADAAHLAGNAVASLVFVTAVARWLGPGVAGMLVLLAGAVGNLLTAAGYRHGHVSVGASTATFGALGLLAGLQFVRRRQGRSRRRAWIALGAGLALFAMLGVGERADVVAHIFGLAGGAVLGVAVAPSLRLLSPGRLRGWGLQLVLAAVALGIVVGCWMAALAVAGPA